MSQAISSCAMRQIRSNLYSCSAKLLWVFKLTVMFSNWNINLFKPLIWSPQWRITKYFIVSDLLKFYNQFCCSVLFPASAEWSSLSLPPVHPHGCSQRLGRALWVSLRCQQSLSLSLFLMSSFSRIPTNFLWSEATVASLTYFYQDFACLILAISRTKLSSFFLFYYQPSWHK